VKCGARVALGVAGGYFLGRTKKMKVAMMLAGMAAGRRAGGPGELLKGGTKLLNASPELSRLTDVMRGRLLEAGKGAALAVATRQVESLTDRVGKRVESLGDLGGPRPGESQDEPPEDDVADDRADDLVEDEGPSDDDAEPESAPASGRADADDEEEAPAPRRSRAQATRGGKSSSATATARRGTAAGAGGGTRTVGAAGKAAAGRKPGRTTRTRRGEGNG
jgi:hypothetical protein